MVHPTIRHFNFGPALAVGALALGAPTFLAACGDDDAEAGTIEVTAVDFEFEDLPDTVPVGTILTLRNDAEAELHELVAVRIDDAEERSVEELMALPPEEMGATLFAGEPTMVLIAPPGGEQIAAVGDGTLTEPGRYAVMCFIPTGADPDAYMAAAATSEGPPDVPGGPPHIANGMFAELTVEG